MSDKFTGPGSVAIVIVNYRTPDFVKACLESIEREKTVLPGLKVIVVDNASADDSVEKLTALMAMPRFADWVDFFPLDFNGGFGWGNNQAMLRLMQQTEPPEFIHVLNPDTEIEPGAVSHLLSLLNNNPRIAAAGSQLFEYDGRMAGSAFNFPSCAREFVRGSHTPAIGRVLGIKDVVARREKAGPVDWVTGASVMFRTVALREVGLFDDGFFLYFEEIELMWRLKRAGWQIWTEPASHVKHLGGAATGIVSGGNVAVLPRPPYWFKSRRRLFALIYGARGAHLAGLAWLLGDMLWSIRKMTGLGTSEREIPGERRAFMEYGLRASKNDLTPNVVQWNDTPGKSPQWSQH